MAAATTVRLPDELDARLAAYCERTGAGKNRVIGIALREYLVGDDSAGLPEREAAIVDELRETLDARELES